MTPSGEVALYSCNMSYIFFETGATEEVFNTTTE